MRLKEFTDFVIERENIRIKREQGLPKPWTKNNILQHYRFCNIRREDDKVTQWIADNWRIPHQYDPNLWFAMTVARYINLPETLEEIGYPCNNILWKKKIPMVLERRKQLGQKMFNPAYIVSTNGVLMNKGSYITERVFTPLWGDRKKLQRKYFDSLNEFHMALMKYQGMGSFMAAQVIADVKYAAPYREMTDWNRFVAPGPGSIRGLNRFFKRDIKKSWPLNEFKEKLWDLQDATNTVISKLKWPMLHAQDIQNCLCEFDKYERLRLGEGQVKAKYNGTR